MNETFRDTFHYSCNISQNIKLQSMLKSLIILFNKTYGTNVDENSLEFPFELLQDELCQIISVSPFQSSEGWGDFQRNLLSSIVNFSITECSGIFVLDWVCRNLVEIIRLRDYFIDEKKVFSLDTIKKVCYDPRDYEFAIEQVELLNPDLYPPNYISQMLTELTRVKDYKVSQMNEINPGGEIDMECYPRKRMLG